MFFFYCFLLASSILKFEEERREEECSFNLSVLVVIVRKRHLLGENRLFRIDFCEESEKSEFIIISVIYIIIVYFIVVKNTKLRYFT